MQERDQAVQKRAYKILAFICAVRQDFARPHLAEVLAMLLSGVTSSLSAAKRHRLRCLQVSSCAPQCRPCHAVSAWLPLLCCWPALPWQILTLI